VLIITVIFSVTILPQAFALYFEIPSQETIFIPIMIIATILISWIFVISIGLATVKNKRITIKDSLLFYVSGKENKTINLNIVNNITERNQISYVYSGKVFLPIVNYWFIFHDDIKQKQEILLVGWDTNTIKNMLYYIKGKFPKLKINTSFYRDSSEELAGISELLK